MINVDISNIWGELSLTDLLSIEQEIFSAHAALMEGTGPGSTLRGWLELPTRTPSDDLRRIQKAAETIRDNSDVCVVVGIGGSCLGSRAVIELLQGPNRNIGKRRGDPQILFAGNCLSPRRWNEVAGLLEGKDFSVIVISKSGDTLESAIALRGLKWMLERKYGTDEANHRIYAITDPGKGALREMASFHGWESFSIPPSVDGGFSVLTPAGLLPMAAAGIDIMKILTGAMDAKESCDLRSFENPVWLYAAVRNLMYRGGKAVEIFTSWEPDFKLFGTWWQQLFASSEGKDGKGLFPATAEFPADLHSLGQMIQQGRRNLFETVVRFDPPRQTHIIGSDARDLDGLNYLAGQGLDFVNEQSFQSALAAHTDGGIPVISMECGELAEGTVGELLYFLELSCAVSAYTLGVNPFDRPGVELYKANTRNLLGRDSR